jgi:hypothetical protein
MRRSLQDALARDDVGVPTLEATSESEDQSEERPGNVALKRGTVRPMWGP